MSNHARDGDLYYYRPHEREITIRIRDIFEECANSNPRWLPGLLIEEMCKHGLIDGEMEQSWRTDLGL
jgi:hypothetical protein